MKHAFSWAAKRAISALFIAALSACSTDGDRDPVVEPDKPDPERVVYQGRVIDGYLRNALVWLDLNHNYVPDADEPSTLSGKGGVFRFSARELEGIEAPHQYALMVHAIADCGRVRPCVVTQDEDLMVRGDENSGQIPMSYFLAAPPGVTTITPLSTLVKVEFDRQLTDPALNPVSVSIATAHASVRTSLDVTDNLLQDYLASDNAKLAAYAKALVTTQQFNLAQLNSDSETALSNLDAATAVGLSFKLLANAPNITDIVDRISWTAPTADAMAAFDYLRDFPVLDLVTEWPEKFVLSRIEWSVAATTKDTGTELDPIVGAEGAVPETPLKQIASVEYDWRPNGRIAGAIIDGWLIPAFSLERTLGVVPWFAFNSELPRTAFDGKPDLVATSTLTNGRTTAINMKLLTSPVPPDYSALPLAFVYSENGVLETVTETMEDGERKLTFAYEDGRLTRRLLVPSYTDPQRAEEIVLTYAEGLPDVATRQLRVILPASEPTGEEESADIELGAAEVLSHTKFRYEDGKATSTCERTIDTDDFDICTHYRYETGVRTHEYLKEHAHLDASFKDPTGNGRIVAIAKYLYAAFLDTAN